MKEATTEFKAGDVVVIQGKKYMVMKKLGKHPWMKRIYEAVRE